MVECGLVFSFRCRGLCNLFEPQLLVAIQDLYRAVEQSAHDNFVPRPRQGGIALEYLVETVLAAHGPVVGHHPDILETEYLAQLAPCGHGPMQIGLAARRPGELAVQRLHKAVLEQFVGLLGCGNPLQSEFFHEAVMVDPVFALD